MLVLVLVLVLVLENPPPFEDDSSAFAPPLITPGLPQPAAFLSRRTLSPVHPGISRDHRAVFQDHPAISPVIAEISPSRKSSDKDRVEPALPLEKVFQDQPEISLPRKPTGRVQVEATLVMKKTFCISFPGLGLGAHLSAKLCFARAHEPEPCVAKRSFGGTTASPSRSLGTSEKWRRGPSGPVADGPKVLKQASGTEGEWRRGRSLTGRRP